MLGDRAEDSFRQTMLGSNGQLGVFWSNPLVGTMTMVALMLLLWPFLVAAWKRLSRHLHRQQDRARPSVAE